MIWPSKSLSNSSSSTSRRSLTDQIPWLPWAFSGRSNCGMIRIELMKVQLCGYSSHLWKNCLCRSQRQNMLWEVKPVSPRLEADLLLSGDQLRSQHVFNWQQFRWDRCVYRWLEAVTAARRRWFLEVPVDECPPLKPSIWRVPAKWHFSWRPKFISRTEFEDSLGEEEGRFLSWTHTTCSRTDKFPVVKIFIRKPETRTHQCPLWERPTQF